MWMRKSELVHTIGRTGSVHKPKLINELIRDVFRVMKGRLGYRKVCYRGIANNFAYVLTLLALANPYPARAQPRLA